MVSIPDIQMLYQSDKVSRMKNRSQKDRLFSSMTWGIMLFNAFALAILAGSLIYAKNYQNVLLTREAFMLQGQAETYAETLVENAIVVDDSQPKKPKVELNKEKASLMILRFAEKRRHRIILFDSSNSVLADSNELIEYKTNLNEKIKRNFLMSFLKKEQPYIEGVMRSVVKKKPSSSWASVTKDAFHVYAGFPIIHSGEYVGAILVSTRADFMNTVSHAMQFEILIIFFGTLCFTIILSIYFSRQLAKPLRQLAEYADKVRQNVAIEERPPDFSSRDDEIGDLSLVLGEMTESLQKRMESIEQFAADVSHELKNPLTSIRSAIETLPKVTDSKKQAQLHEIIEQDLWRMDRLITDISRASRLDAQLIKEMMEPFDLKAMLKENIQMQSDLINRLIEEGKLQSNKIAIHFLDASSKSKVMVNGLQARMSQVFDNVIMNAASFSHDDAAITVTLMADEEFAMVIIDDEGPGIPDGNFDKIFDRFYTDRPAGTSGTNNSGLGLNIAKQIIEAHKGTIWAENREEDDEIEGARFIILIPVMRKKHTYDDSK